MVLKQLKSAAAVYHHLPRYREIFHVLFKYGFVDLLKLIHLKKLLDIADHQLHPASETLHQKPMEERLRMAIEELGPTFVKFGQILSSRRDLVKEAFYNELRKLQDKVPSFPAEIARRIIEKEIGCPIAEVFKEFEDKPIAAASIAQVHRATLRNGERVAVKVRRPDIEKIIEVDISILMDLARFLERHVLEIAALNPVGITREFARTIELELDFTHEARNMDRFMAQMKEDIWIRVPDVYDELSSERVLVMEMFEGLRIEDVETLRAHLIDPVMLSERISKLIFHQMFDHGFFHGDPHPGNMTVLENGVLVLYDYGMMGTLPLPFRENIASMILGLVEKDAPLVARALLMMSENGFVEDPRRLEADVNEFAQEHLDVPLKDLRLGLVFNRLLDLLMLHRLRMKADFYLGIKALSQVEASGLMLNPNLNFVQFGEPFAARVLENRFGWQRILKTFTAMGSETLDFLRDLPRDARELYDKVRLGRYHIPIEHQFDPKGLEPLRQALNQNTNRLAGTVLAASILICSSILILAQLQPLWNGMPLLGLFGLAVGGWMAFRIVFAIWRSGGL
ncbi:MAG: AarF/ABC1/UbiB kinase family protein [Verrucomicrobia bacterium]|nr:AarF/ABC1/UbiB kinase family protein [Verrucomicrobiota bacterium]